MPTEPRHGIDTHWITVGEGERPALFLHCSLASATSLRPIMEGLSDFLSSAAPDLPGHGKSGDWTGEGDYVGTASQIAESFCAGPRDIVGHSLGAVVALALMTRRPDLVRRAILIEPVLFAAAKGTDAFDRYMSDHAPMRAALEAGDRDRATEIFTDHWGTGQSWAAIPARQREAMASRIHLIEETGPACGEDSCNILGAGRLEATSAPVMLIRGENTHPVIPAISDTLASRLPDATEVVIPGAGHMAPLTHGSEVSWHIHEHIRRRYE